MASQVTGGKKLAAFLRRAKAAQAASVKAVDVGFISHAKYPDGTTVASVAAWNEFGTERKGQTHVPERPYFRNALRGAEPELAEVIAENIDPRTMALDATTAGKMGQHMVGRIERSITTLRAPPNAPATIKAKGSNNPLVNTRVLVQHVTYRVDK